MKIIDKLQARQIPDIEYLKHVTKGVLYVRGEKSYLYMIVFSHYAKTSLAYYDLAEEKITITSAYNDFHEIASILIPGCVVTQIYYFPTMAEFIASGVYPGGQQ
jgi:hypothetical protein